MNLLFLVIQVFLKAAQAAILIDAIRILVLAGESKGRWIKIKVFKVWWGSSQWRVPEGDQGESMAVGVYGQWIYVNPSKQVIIVKTSADPDFMSKGYELKHVEFFRAVTDGIS